jgi:succinate dehydrogenase / fumarate reductase flavoprotein subunit
MNKRKLPTMYHQFKELAEVDITTTPMEVGPTLHYFMGGIRVDAETQQTNIAGLFACGECAAGLHGANRLGGNSLSDLIVFGRLAGIGAAAYLAELSATPRADDGQITAAFRGATDILNRESGENPYLMHEALQEVMSSHVGIVRTGEELETAVDQLQALKARAQNLKAPGTSQYNPGWHEALSFKSLLIVGEAVARAAYLREESRGAHTRLDFEGERDECARFNVVTKKGPNGEMRVEKVMRPDPPEELAAIAHATLEELEKGLAR